MPPTDDEIRAATERALKGLREDVDLALKTGDRKLALQAAGRYRMFFREAIRMRDGQRADRISADMTPARDRVVRELGTAAWEEPETVEQAKARMGTLPAAPGASTFGPGGGGPARDPEPSPLTDEELDHLEREAKRFTAPEPWEGNATETIVRLLAEVRRLRSDEWLERAADEIDGGMDALNETGPSRNEILDILRKHRDGR